MDDKNGKNHDFFDLGDDYDPSTDEDFIELCKEITAYIEDDSEDDQYVADPVQMGLLFNTIAFLDKLAEDDKEFGEGFGVQPLEIHKHLRNVDVVARYICANFSKEDLQTFSKILTRVSGFSVNPRTDGTLDVELIIPNVYVRKKS